MVIALFGAPPAVVNAILVKVIPGAFNWNILVPEFIVAKSVGFALVPPLIIKLAILIFTTLGGFHGPQFPEPQV